jgi:hypothetical protein
MSKRIRFTRHATERIEQRGLNIAAVIRAIEGPLWTECDPADPSLTRYYSYVDEDQLHILRVVVRDIDGEEALVVTALIDRNAVHRNPRQMT